MIVCELQYFPPVSFFSTLFGETYFYLDIFEIYRKMSFRNRCLIAGAQGVISLSVPLHQGRNQQLPMNEVRISNTEQWQSRHFKSIRSAYNRSPFFDFYQDELAAIYRRPFGLLADWNTHCLEWVKEKLGWETEIRFTDSPILYQSDGITDLRNRIVPKNFMEWKPAKYRQVFEERTGFFPNLSVLDLLFNTGPRASELLGNSDARV
ncbi:MAG TPA: WbqC family protein [Puia sp.]|nr:WbqC family protein [Puia sp.]